MQYTQDQGLTNPPSRSLKSWRDMTAVTRRFLISCVFRQLRYSANKSTAMHMLTFLILQSAQKLPEAGENAGRMQETNTNERSLYA